MGGFQGLIFQKLILMHKRWVFPKIILEKIDNQRYCLDMQLILNRSIKFQNSILLYPYDNQKLKLKQKST